MNSRTDIMDKDEMETESISYTLKGTSETLLPLQLFEFKTHLLEAVEELRMGRFSKIQYEEQISKILMEKQELAWRNESLSSKEEILEKRHQDALAALKKQFQAKMCTVEEEKGWFQLTAETKEREILGLRQEIKVLQLSKYNLQKNVQEMKLYSVRITFTAVICFSVVYYIPDKEQKLQLHILAKEDHMKQLSECEKCFGNVTQQFLMIKEVHEKLEQNVQAAIQHNKKLKAEIKDKNEEIDRLKEALQKLSSEFMNCKVTYQERTSKENVGLLEKDQQLKELQERLQTEVEINKRLMEINFTLKEEKQEGEKSQSTMITLIHRHTQTITNLEKQLSVLKEEYKTLERDNELQRANATENEEKFLALQSEHKEALRCWREEEQRICTKKESIQKELESVKEINKQLQRKSAELYEMAETSTQVQEALPVHVPSAKDDSETGVCGTIIHIDSNDAINPNSDSSSSDNATELNKEIQGWKSDIVHHDIRGLPNVYIITDKEHLCAEQTSDSNLAENKAKLVVAQPNLKERSKKEPTEEIPAESTGLQDPDEDEESAAKCSSTVQTQAIMESVNFLLDNNKPSTVCIQDASQQTDCSHRQSGDGTSEVVYIGIDKADTTENNQGVLINEARGRESQLLPQSTEQLINEQSADREGCEAETNTSCTTWDGNHYLSCVINCSTTYLDTGSSLRDENKNFKTGPIEITEKNKDKLNIDSLLCSQTKKELLKAVISEAIDKTYDSSVNCKALERSSCETSVEKRHVGQEQTSGSLLTLVADSCEGQVMCVHLQPTSDHKLESQEDSKNSPPENTSLTNVSNIQAGRRESCPLGIKDDANLHGSNNVNVRDLSTNGNSGSICLTDPGDEPLCVDNEDIKRENNLPVSYTQESEQLPTLESLTENIELSKENASTEPQSEKTSDKLSNSKSLVCLPGDTSWNSLAGHNSLSKQSSYPLSNPSGHGSAIKRLAFDNLSTDIHPVPRKDHSAEWNAVAQMFHNPSFPTEHADMKEKPHHCSVTPAAASAIDMNATQTTGQGNMNIQHQINAIERFLLFHKLSGPKRRKLEESNEAKGSKEENII
ncbi:coiled-coil domain-containing protein 73 isoform X2 [Hyperolius riggenbachi]|uniref:coiled-coil domain-containing protein 73 isoform X2 n=1 Tax=Hyperolius riggenbachi TaxID=752182 RepID=UPI0035A35AEA